MLTKLINLFRGRTNPTGDDNSSETVNDINEPVLSFVRCFKENPKRFRVDTYHEYMSHAYGTHRLALVTDKKINKVYTLCTSGEVNPKFIDVTDVLTEKEICYIVDTMMDYYTTRSRKLRKLRKIRRDRGIGKLRAELTEVYNG